MTVLPAIQRNALHRGTTGAVSASASIGTGTILVILGAAAGLVYLASRQNKRHTRRARSRR